MSRLTPLELKQKLGLPGSTLTNRIHRAALRQLCAGGAELLDAKEWASGIAGRSRDPVARKVGEEALQRLCNIEREMLASLEREYQLDEGELTDRL